MEDQRFLVPIPCRLSAGRAAIALRFANSLHQRILTSGTHTNSRAQFPPVCRCEPLAAYTKRPAVLMRCGRSAADRHRHRHHDAQRSVVDGGSHTTLPIHHAQHGLRGTGQSTRNSSPMSRTCAVSTSGQAANDCPSAKAAARWSGRRAGIAGPLRWRAQADLLRSLDWPRALPAAMT